MSRDRLNALRLLIAYAALLFYASFYPFAFNWARLSDASLSWGYSAFGDRLINLLAYVPLGLLLVACGRGAGFATAAGFTMSLVVELSQNATKARNPNLYDLFFNTVGTALGAVLCLPVRPWIARGFAKLRSIELASPAGLLLLLWIALHSAPFIGVIDRGKILASFDPSWSWIGVLRWTAMWMVFAAATTRLFRARWLLPLAALSMFSRFFFLLQSLDMNQVLGLIPGLALSRMPGAFVFAAIAMFMPSPREPRYLYWMETVYLAAGAGWMFAARFRTKGSQNA